MTRRPACNLAESSAEAAWNAAGRWYDAVRPYFSGNLIVGRDLLEI
jgi:hypothetical protein